MASGNVPSPDSVPLEDVIISSPRETSHHHLEFVSQSEYTSNIVKASEIRSEGQKAALRLEKTRQQLRRHLEVLARLRTWRDWESDRQVSLRRFLLSRLYSKRPPCPTHQDLRDLAEYFFPLRDSIRVSICDFGEGRFERYETTVGQIETCGHPSQRLA